LWQLPRTEKYQSDHENEEQFGAAEGLKNEGKHGSSYLPENLEL
jgi:hypothetical protein